MLSSPILLAMLAGASAATWTLCLKLGSTRVTAALGALVVTSGAFVMNAIVLLVMRGARPRDRLRLGRALAHGGGGHRRGGGRHLLASRL